jgi:DNA sulfur modification protein DndB
MSNFEYTFPSIKGVQAGRDYYVTMCPLRLIPRIFIFDEEELTPELRAQRTLNRSRIPEMSRYILENKFDYVFSAITASINGDVRFTALGNKNSDDRLGLLHVDMNNQFIINDGQHRRAAIEQAIKEDPSLGDETIAVVFFVDQGLSRSQQMFADLNRYAIRASKSLGLLYDQRNDLAKIGKLVALKSETFKGMVELERSSLSERSRKLFTLSALCSATEDFLGMRDFQSSEDAANAAIRFWDELGKHIPEWQLVRKSKMTAGEIRRDFIHSHGVLLQAFGRIGASLNQSGKPVYTCLSNLKKINWSRSNAVDWEGRVMIGGRLTKATNSVVLATAFIKKNLGIELAPDEIKADAAFKKSRVKTNGKGI